MNRVDWLINRKYGLDRLRACADCESGGAEYLSLVLVSVLIVPITLWLCKRVSQRSLGILMFS